MSEHTTDIDMAVSEFNRLRLAYFPDFDPLGNRDARPKAEWTIQTEKFSDMTLTVGITASYGNTEPHLVWNLSGWFDFGDRIQEWSVDWTGRDVPGGAWRSVWRRESRPEHLLSASHVVHIKTRKRTDKVDRWGNKPDFADVPDTKNRDFRHATVDLVSEDWPNIVAAIKETAIWRMAQCLMVPATLAEADKHDRMANEYRAAAAKVAASLREGQP